MKKFLFILFVIASVVKQSRAQTNVYHPFPDSAIWRVDVSYDKWFLGPCHVNYYFHYYISGDTLMNSYVYKKVYRSFVQHSMPFCNPLTLDSGYIGALRDDIIANKTFLVFQNKNDTLLYDYNLKAGDTLKGVITFSCNNVILSVDSVLVNGQYRKRWNYKDCDSINQ